MVKDVSTSWLTELALEVARSTSPESLGLTFKAYHVGEFGTYQIYGIGSKAEPIAQTNVWKLYPVVLQSGQIVFMKIAASADMNERIQREERILNQLQSTVSEQNQAAEKLGQKPYPYGNQFPIVQEGFDAGGRWALILKFHDSIMNYQRLEPLAFFIQKYRMDLQSAVWLLGKLLQLIDFFYRGCDLRIGKIDVTNILIEREKHAVFVLDFSQYKLDPSELDHKAEVKKIARMVWLAAGGDDIQNPPHDTTIMSKLHHNEFVTSLLRMMENPNVALEEYADLYEFTVHVWGLEPGVDGPKRVWHPFQEYVR